MKCRRFAAFHLGIHYLSKYPFSVFQYANGINLHVRRTVIDSKLSSKLETLIMASAALNLIDPIEF